MTGLLGTLLVLLSVSSFGLAGTFYETSGALDDPTPVYPHPRITEDILGELSECRLTNEVLEGRLTQFESDVMKIKDQINTNSGKITQNTGDIAQHTGDIAQNTGDIAQHTGDIAQNTGDIAQNTGDIALPNTGVAVCGYRESKYDTGTITYDSISGKTTDGSYMDRTSGQFHAATTGYYSITFSARTLGRTAIYLYKERAPQGYDTRYWSDQESGENEMGSYYYEIEMGSRSGVLCVRAGQLLL